MIDLDKERERLEGLEDEELFTEDEIDRMRAGRIGWILDRQETEVLEALDTEQLFEDWEEIRQERIEALLAQHEGNAQ